MNSWPDVYLPPLNSSLAFPALTLNSHGIESTVIPSSGEVFTMYVCGITPYDATHLGHASTYLTFDLINRFVHAGGGSVTFVENITDIDDPLLERAERDKVDWQKLAANQIDLFKSDMSALHILPPAHFIPVTRIMTLVEEAISRLISNGYTYLVDKDLYFDTSSFLKDLPISVEQAIKIFAERGGDPARIGKKHPLDPILWMSAKSNEPSWSSVHGEGRPGWHIECSVIALRYLLGESFLFTNSASEFNISLQGGGSDLIFPHHFMSAAQAEALTGKKFARIYLHTGMMGLDGEKMSKSKGNLVFVSKLLAQGVDPMVLRHALLDAQYSQDRMWSNDILELSAQRVNRIREALSRQQVTGSKGLIAKIIGSLSNNLNTPEALQFLDIWAEEQLSQDIDGAETPGEVSRAIDLLMGLAL